MSLRCAAGLADAEYTWPPRCNLCNRTLTADRDGVVRLVCKDMFHRQCLHEHLSRAISTQHVATAKLQCPSCNLLLVDPATQPRTKLRESVQQFVQQVARGEGATSSSSSSSSGAASPGINHRATASPLAASSSASAASGSGSAESRYSPAVRELMAKATSARAALPAGTPHTAIALGPDAAMSSPPSAVGNGSSSGGSSSGIYSGGSTAVSRNVAALAAASPLSSSSSSTTASVFSSHRFPDDIEAQADGHKGHKTPRSRFGALRAAATKGGWMRRAFCQWRPQKIVLAVMAVALMMALILYIRFTASMMEGAAPSLAAADASAALTPPAPLIAATPDMQLLDQQ